MAAAAAGFGVAGVDDHVADFPDEGIFATQDASLLYEAAGQLSLIHIYLDSISIIIGQAMGLAMITVVGQCLGAGEPEQAERQTKKLMRWAVSYTHLDVYKRQSVVKMETAQTYS